MTLTFPRYISWKVFFTNNDPFSPFGSQTRYRIRRSITILKDAGYTFAFEDVDDRFFDQFIPVYEKIIGEKERGTVFPVRQRVSDGKRKGKEYYGLSLYDKNQVFVGGMIFSKVPSNDYLGINYKVFPYTVSEKTPIAPTFVAEYYFYEHAVSKGYQSISHGLDRNIYGYHSNIGLATHKMQAGSRPFVHLTNPLDEPNEILNSVPVFSEDMFIITGNTHEQFATQALFISEQPQEELKKKFPILFSNEYFTTTIVPHNEIPANPEWK